jgi:hypothetical protein
MTINVIIDDTETGITESVQVDEYLVITNVKAGWVLNETRYANGTCVLTLKREQSSGS